MSDKHPTTQKAPKGEEIPVPTREEVMRDLKKAATPTVPSPTRRKKK